ncbi:MAG: zinc ribbon domain-containing protein [Clostridia bacterium]|nr:zinc ribbon domain-containing protein [Clostridia bacterium]
MHCTKCGQKIKNSSIFCSYCGSQQLENPEGGLPDVEKMIKEAEVYDIPSIVSAVCVVILNTISFMSFRITDIDENVFYITGFPELIFEVLYLCVVFLAAFRKRTLLGKVVSQIAAMSITSVTIHFIGSFVLNLIKHYDVFLPQLAEGYMTGHVVTGFVLILVCIIALVICNFVSSKKDVTQRVRYTNISYFFLCMYAGIPFYEIISESVRMNSEILDKVVGVSATDTLFTLDVVFCLFSFIVFMVFFVIGLVAEKGNTKLMCAISSAITSLYMVAYMFIPLYNDNMVLISIIPRVMFICFVVMSVVMIIAVCKKYFCKSRQNSGNII